MIVKVYEYHDKDMLVEILEYIIASGFTIKHISHSVAFDNSNHLIYTAVVMYE